MSQHPVYRFDDFLVDQDNWSLTCDGQEIHLEPVVLKLLIYLITHRDRLVTRKELMDTVWGDTVISESALTKAVARLRKALKDDSGHPSYLETVHSQGFRFIATVEEVARPTSSAKSRRGPIVRNTLLSVATIVIALLLLMFWPRAQEKEALETGAIRSLAVLPLSNLTGDPGQDHFADGLQDILITELSQVPGLRVTSRQSTRRYRASELAAREIAAELGVDAIVEGSLLSAGDDVALTIQLVDGRSDEHRWAQHYERETARLFDLAAEVALTIASVIDLEWPQQPPVRISDAVDPRAIDAYALGITYMDRFTPDGIRSAIAQFERAVAIEPKFALAWGNLGAAHSMLGLYGYTPPRESKEKLRAAVLKAIEADGRSFFGYSGLGWVRWWTGDFERACESFAEALRLNPSAPYAIHGDADCLMFEGRMEESVARTRELLMVSPFSAMHNAPLPNHLFVAGRFDEAIAAATDMQARTPQFSMHWFLAKVYWRQGQLDKALEEERLELERRGDIDLLVALEAGLSADGPSGALRAMAEALVARADEKYVDPFDIAETFARAGSIDEALHWLNKAVEHGSYEVNYVAFMPQLDVLREDPRFGQLLERVYGEQVPRENM